MQDNPDHDDAEDDKKNIPGIDGERADDADHEYGNYTHRRVDLFQDRPRVLVWRSRMELALDQLLLAFAKADPARGDGSKIEWEDIELAFAMARQALPGRYLEFVRELLLQDVVDA